MESPYVLLMWNVKGLDMHGKYEAVGPGDRMLLKMLESMQGVLHVGVKIESR